MDGIFHAVAAWAEGIFAGMRGRRWLRRTAATILIVLILYTLGGFFGVPYLMRRVLTGQVASALKRPVTVGAIAFNPFRLRLEVAGLHVGDRDPQLRFVDLKQLRVKVSWTSLFRLAPIVGEFYTDGLMVHVVRTGEQRFNFSDLIEKSANAPPAKAQLSKPQRFAVSNIQLNDGEIDFDDQTLHQQHRVEHIRLAVPFIANLPADVDIFVQPFLQMTVDGSRFLLVGHTKPFASTVDTIVNLNLHRLALAPYMAYVPEKLPVKLTDGMLSALIELHFINAENHPQIKFDGAAALEKVDLRDAAGAPLLSLGRGVVTLDNVEPLESLVHLKRIYVESLNAHLVRNADGTTNLTALAGSSAPAPAPQAQSSVSASAAMINHGLKPVPLVAASPTPSPAAVQPPNHGLKPVPLAQMQVAAPSPTPQAQSSPAAEKAPLDFALGTFEMADSAVDLTDRSHPAVLTINAIHATLDQLHTVGEGLAPFELNAKLASGGALAVKGKLDLTHQQASTEATLNQIDLAGLKAFAAPFLTGELASGKLTAQASVRTDFAPGKFNVHAEPAGVSVENFNLKGPDGKAEPLGWGKLAVAVGQFDLATQQAVVNEIRIDRLRVSASRNRQGQIDLVSLVRRSASPATTAPAPKKIERRARIRRARKPANQPAPVPIAAAAPAWKYRVLSVVFDKTEIHLLDEHGAKPVKLEIVPLGLNLKDISDDLSKPIGVELDGIVNSKGSFKIEGTAAPAPLDAKLRITTKRLDLSAVNAYLGDQINARFNATIATALLTMNGIATATNRRHHLRAGYRGDLTLGGVQILDKLTGDSFLRWRSLSANRVAADYGAGRPKVRIGGLTLANFYSRVILNSNGTLNLKDITSSPNQAAKSLTRPGVAGPPRAATPSPAPTPAPASNAAPASPQPLPADVRAGWNHARGRSHQLHRQLHPAALFGGPDRCRWEDRRVRHRLDQARRRAARRPGQPQRAAHNHRFDQSAEPDGLSSDSGES